MSSFLSAVARGGLMFMLIIWLQGIWLPRHGYSFTETPLWAGIYMLPLTLGFLIAGPASGYLSDRYGARPFATGGMLAAAVSFVLLELLPIDFPYPAFAAILLLNGLAMGSFASPNRAGDHEQPPSRRPWRRRRHEPDLPELRPGALDRDLLHANDRRASPRRCPPASPPACEPTECPRAWLRGSAASPRSRSCSLLFSAITRSRSCSARMR